MNDNNFFNNFEAMYDRAIEIADLKAEIWDLGESYLYIEVSSKYISSTGTDNFGDSCLIEYPYSYLILSDEEITLREKVLYKAKQDELARKKTDQQAREKEHRRGLYIKLNKEFRNEMIPEDK